MAIDSRWQWGQDRASIRLNPAFAPITGRARRNHEVLHQKGLIALEARSCRNGDLHHLLFDADPGRHLAPEPPLLLFDGPGRLGPLVHAARFDRGTALQTFQTRDLFALLANDLFQGGNFAKQFNQQSFKLWTAQRGKGRWPRHTRLESDHVEPVQEKNAAVPTLLPLLRFWVGSPLAAILQLRGR